MEVTPEDLARLIDASATNDRNFVTVNNVVLDRSKVTCLIQDPDGEHKVVVYYDSGDKVTFSGSEAALVWKEFDTEDYKQ